jgi:hypothetical protein
MALKSPINLSDEDKLEVLQRLDQFRLWHSLDEKRYCLVCGKLITGQEVHVTGGENGPLRVSCPTEHCNAIPMNWVRPTDEVLIKIAKLITAGSRSADRRTSEFPHPQAQTAQNNEGQRAWPQRHQMTPDEHLGAYR